MTEPTPILLLPPEGAGDDWMRVEGFAHLATATGPLLGPASTQLAIHNRVAPER